MIEALRTPDERFENLHGYAFQPHYLDSLPGYEGLRLHYLDEGPVDAEKVFLCLHGNPTWSYLWRRMIPIITAAGHRVVAPDLFGYGRSDKPVDPEVHSFDFHRGTVTALIEALDLDRITLTVHEWGGTVGLTVPPAMPERFSGLFVMSTLLATGRPLPEGYRDWKRISAEDEDLNVRAVMARTNRILNFGECNAYGAPFPDARYKTALRVVPSLIPAADDAPGAALSREALAWLGEAWRGSGVMMFGARDPLIGQRRMMELVNAIPSMADPFVFEHVGHFTPEWGDEFTVRALQVLAEQDAIRAAAEDQDDADGDGDGGDAPDGPGGDG